MLRSGLMKLLVCLPVCLIAWNWTIAQEDEKQLRTKVYDFENLVLAKLIAKGDKVEIVVLAEAFEEVTKEVNVQRTKQETRTRMVPVTQQDGTVKQVQQTFTVAVPVSEKVKVNTFVSKGEEAQKIPLDKALFFTLQGKALAKDEVSNAFEKVTSVFLVRSEMEHVPAAMKSLQKTLGDKCLVLATKALAGPILANPAEPANLPVVPLAAPPVPQAFAAPAMRLAPAMPVVGFRPVAQGSAFLFQPEHVVMAKLDASGDEPKLVCMVESFRTEEREGMVTKMRVEQRTRTITRVVEGKPVQEEVAYQVRVPYTEKGTTSVQIPAGKKPAVANWDECVLYRVDGTEIDLKDAKALLSSTCPVFLYRGTGLEFVPPNELFQRLISPDAIVVLSDAEALYPSEVQR